VTKVNKIRAGLARC